MSKSFFLLILLTGTLISTAQNSSVINLFKGKDIIAIMNGNMMLTSLSTFKLFNL